MDAPNLIRVEDHIINLAAVTWVNLDHLWKEERRHYKEQPNGLMTFVESETVTLYGIYIRFVDGSDLTFPDTLPAYAVLRARLLGDALPDEPRPTGGYNSTEAAVIASLPPELQAIINSKG